MVATAATSATAATAAFSIQRVDLQPEVVPPGGTVRLAIDVLNTQAQVTAGDYVLLSLHTTIIVLAPCGPGDDELNCPCCVCS